MASFARRLHHLMLEKGLSQSDVARSMWGTIQDGRGYDVAKGRDRISEYVRGQSIPEPRNLKKLAEVLDVTVEQLAPDLAAASVDRADPELSLTVVTGQADKVHLKVNRLLPLSIASQIVALISGSDERGKA